MVIELFLKTLLLFQAILPGLYLRQKLKCVTFSILPIIMHQVQRPFTKMQQVFDSYGIWIRVSTHYFRYYSFYYAMRPMPIGSTRQA